MAQQLGPYLLEAELGRGGMGVVWRARDPALERPVAIKVLLAPLGGPDEVARVRREALAQARLRHPSIVGLHAVGTTPAGQPYLVLDLVEGESLAARLARGGPLAPRAAAEVVVRLARAVEYAHGRGVLHRDLKARNVLLDPAGEPVLIDFGLAALDGRRSLTATGEVLGTPGCLAPEQAAADRGRVGPRTDVYGLGVVLFEALTGRPPFEGRDVIGLLSAVLERPAPPPSSLRPGIDPALDAVALRCLEKEPARRFPSAEAVAAALEACLAPRARARRRSLAAPALALGAGVALGLVVGRRPWAAPATPPGALSPGPASPAPPVAPARDLVRRAEAHAAAGRLAAARLDLAAAARLEPGPALVAASPVGALLSGPVAPDALDALCRGAPPDALALAGLAATAAGRPERDALAASAAAAAADGPAGVAARARAALGLGRALARDPRAPADLEAAAGLEPAEPLARAAAAAHAGEAADVAGLAAAGDGLGAALVLTLVGLRALDAGQPDAALAALDEALASCPDCVPALERRLRSGQALAAREPARRRALLAAAAADGERLLALRGVDDLTLTEGVARLHRDLGLDPEVGLDPVALGAARLVLERGLASRPGEPLLLLARAELRARTGDAEGAEADAAAALAGTPDPVSAARALALRVQLRLARGQAEAALALAVPPRQAAAFVLSERALVRVVLRDPPGALEDAERACRDLPGHARSHLALARAQLARGLEGREAARRETEEALRLDPALVPSLIDRALYGGGSAPERRRDLDAALRLEPWSTAPRRALAAALAADGDPGLDDAIAAVLAQDPASPEGRLMRAGRRARAKDLRGALTDCAIAAEGMPWVPSAWAELAVLRQDLGDLAGALEAAERCLRLPDGAQGRAGASALRVTAAVLLERGALPDARAAADRALALDPDDPTGLAVRGRIRGGLRDLRGALDDFDAALRLRPDAALTRLDRAAVLLELGERARVADELEALLPLLRDPAHLDAARRLLERARP